MPNANSNSSGQMMMILAVVVCFCLFISSVATGGLLFYNKSSSSSSSSAPGSSSTTTPEAPAGNISKGITTTVKSKSLDQNVWAMTDMDIDCSKDDQSVGIQGFDLGTSADTSPVLQYTYTCANGKNVSSGGVSTYANYPIYNPDGSNKYSAAELWGTIYMDRQGDIKCPNDTLLNKVKLTQSTSNIYYGTVDQKFGKGYLYNYSCKKSDKPLACSTYQTNPTEITDNYNPVKSGLDEPVICPSDSALSYLKPTATWVKRSSTGSEANLGPDGMMYNYTCCKQTN